MVARPGTYQASNNAGELSPEEYGRTDLKQFYAGLKTALNVEPVPQGGSKLAMRTRHLGRVRRRLVAIGLSAVSLPSGTYSAPGQIATADLVPSPVSAVTLVGWSATPAAAGVVARVEYWAAGWVPFAQPFSIGPTSGSITVALPPGQSVMTTNVRVTILALSVTATIAAQALEVKIERDNVGVARIRPFTFSLDQTYVAVLMDRHVDFYRDGVYVGASTMDGTEDQITTLDIQQRLDTMLMFHRDLVSQRILRDGSDTKWLLSDIPFDNIPQVDLGGNYNNQVADIWNLYIRFPGGDSDYSGGKNLSISLTVNGETTTPVQTAAPPDWTATSAADKAALEATSQVDTGITVTFASSGANAIALTVTFVGDGNLGKVNTLAAEVVNTAEAAATVAHTQVGDPGGEPLISNSAGYAQASVFYQDRLITGGFNSKRGAFLASITGEYFDLNTKVPAASGAVLANIDTDGAEQLQHIVRADYLLLFTSEGEYFISDRAIDRTKPPNVVDTGRRGSAADLPVVVADEIIWASRDKTVLYGASYDAVSTRYVSNPISLLAPHIVNGMVDIAFQKPAGVTNAGRLWMPRADGSMTTGILLEGQDITAFVRWQTAGLVRSACVDGKNIPHLLVQRDVAGVPELHFERLEDGLLFDDTIEQDFSPAQQIITGLDIHEGAEVWADADGYVVGPMTVAGAQIDIGFVAANVKVGRWTPPRAESLPLPSEVAERIVVRRERRIHTVRVDLIDTTSIAVGANQQRPRNVALARVGDDDAPQPPVSGEIVVAGIAGFTMEATAVITQTRPGRLAWRGFVLEATS
jgi:hypothetical protein